MINRARGEVPLQLKDGRRFVLVLDHEALLQAAIAYTGKTKLRKLLADIRPLLDEAGHLVLDEDGDPVRDTVPATRCLLYGALLARQPEASLRDATALLMDGEEAVGDALAQAIELAFPDAKPEGETAGNAPRPIRKSSSSGRNGAKRG
jgi:hypothetical protein